MTSRIVYVKSLAFALVSLVFLLYLATILGDIRFASTEDYVAMFKNVSQLKSGDPVRIAGVEVGKVDSVAISHGAQIKVNFNVDSNVDLDKTTTATVRYKDLVGNRFLELQQASTTRGQLKPGGIIPESQTTPSLDLDSLFESFKPLLSGLAPSQLNSVSQEIVSVLQGEGGSVVQLLSTIGSFTGTLANNDALIGDTINNLATALQTIDSHSSTLSDIFVQLQRLISGLNQDKTPILNALDQIQGVSSQATALLTQVRAPLRADVDQVGAISKTLFLQRDSIQLLLDKAPALQKTLLRVGSAGAYFQFFICGLQIKIGDVMTPATYSPNSRCKT